MDKKTQALVEQYARSLVEVAFEQDAVSTIQEEVRQILTVFAETNLKTFLSQENVTSEAKKESLSLFQESCSVYMNNFLEVILLNDRANILYDVLKLVLELFDQEDNTYDVTVTSASPLSEERRAMAWRPRAFRPSTAGSASGWRIFISRRNYSALAFQSLLSRPVT